MAELFEDRRRVLLVAVVAVVALAVGGRMLLRPGQASVPPPLRVARTGTAPKQPALAYVDVVGAVRRPGLYRVRTGARVADVVARAGGPTRRADLELINLAALVADGEQVVVPRRGAAVAAASGTGSGAAAGPVHLNSATVEQLDSLPGVGPVTAQKIVDYRTQHGGFGSVDELDAVAGIGPARLADLRPLVAP
jgi:competence protein ComEA